MTVFVYINPSKQPVNAEHLKVVTDADAADAWFREFDAAAWRLNIQ
jgi:hypothetical protein